MNKSFSIKIKKFARKLGFDLIQIIKAEKSAAGKNLNNWLKKGYNADMEWMKNSARFRADPRKILPNAKTIICLAVNYFLPSPPKICKKDKVKIARYAWPKNYHRIIEKRLKKLEEFIRRLTPCAAYAVAGTVWPKFKSYVDTGPFLERDFAAQASLGFIGKNTCLITRKFGSYVFLAEIITDLALVPDKPAKSKISCGTCRRCIDACPTKALIKPYTLDARKCVSYLTIESRGKIPAALRAKIPPWLFGCDICQEVCPHNVRAKPTKNKEFQLAPIFKTLTLKNLRAIKTEEKFKRIFTETSILRAKFKGIRKNIKFIQISPSTSPHQYP